MEPPADLAALEARVAQLEDVVVAVGALFAEELEPAEKTRVIEKVAALEERFAEAGQTEAVRLVQALRGSIRKPWSLFEWLDTKFFLTSAAGAIPNRRPPDLAIAPYRSFEGMDIPEATLHPRSKISERGGCG